jgi:hypothetical protein
MIRAAEAARLFRSAIASGSIPAAAALIVSPITTATTIIRRAVRIAKVPAAFMSRIAVAAVIVVVALPIFTTVATVIVAILVADELHARLQCLHGLHPCDPSSALKKDVLVQPNVIRAAGTI